MGPRPSSPRWVRRLVVGLGLLLAPPASALVSVSGPPEAAAALVERLEAERPGLSSGAPRVQAQLTLAQDGQHRLTLVIDDEPLTPRALGRHPGAAVRAAAVFVLDAVDGLPPLPPPLVLGFVATGYDAGPAGWIPALGLGLRAPIGAGFRWSGFVRAGLTPIGSPRLDGELRVLGLQLGLEHAFVWDGPELFTELAVAADWERLTLRAVDTFAGPSASETFDQARIRARAGAGLGYRWSWLQLRVGGGLQVQPPTRVRLPGPFQGADEPFELPTWSPFAEIGLGVPLP